MNIPLDDIEFSPTPDLDQDQIKSLSESIHEKGLSHNIIVRPVNSSGKYSLVSGERRILAVQILGWKTIPAEVRDVDENEGIEIKIHENLRRSNLPWYEQAILVERLHKMRQEKFGVAATGRPKADEPKGWSVRDTAEELEAALGAVSEDLQLARAVREDPTLRNIKDKKTAMKLVRIAATRIHAEEDAIIDDEDQEEDLIFLGDSASVLAKLPQGSIHHCITDPPWIKFFDPTLTIDERTLPVLKEVFRVLKPGGFLYMFAGLDDYSYYAGYNLPPSSADAPTEHRMGELEKIGFSVSKTPLIWRKGNSMSRRGVSAWEYDRDFEFIIVAVKGTGVLTTSTKMSSIKEADIVHPSKMIHPNEKPISIIQDLLVDCSYQGQTILDPFAGSGVVGDACRGMSRNYILIERDKNFYDNIMKRLG